MGRIDLERLSKEELIELVLKLDGSKNLAIGAVF